MLTQEQQAMVREEAELMAAYINQVMNTPSTRQAVVQKSGEKTMEKVLEVQDFYRQECVRCLSMIVEGEVANHATEIREACRG